MKSDAGAITDGAGRADSSGVKPAIKPDDIDVIENDLIAEPTSSTAVINQPHQGRCPFKQCVSNTLGPLTPRSCLGDERQLDKLIDMEDSAAKEAVTPTIASPSIRDSSPKAVSPQSAVVEEAPDDELQIDSTTTTTDPPTTTSPPVTGSPPQSAADASSQTEAPTSPQSAPSNPVITGITTIDNIINKASSPPTSDPFPVITGITSIDAIINTLSIDKTKQEVKKEPPLDRSAQILQQLGILHLQDKVTRPRKSEETDEHVLREAGAARYLDDEENEEVVEDEDTYIDKGAAKIATEIDKNRRKMEQMSKRELQILKEAGVTMLDNQVTQSNGINSHIEPCMTATTVGLTTVHPSTIGLHTVNHSESLRTTECHLPPAQVVDSQGVSHTYAEKELLRRLKNGWASSGTDCPECGMPIIYKMEGGEGLMECVICGMLDTNENQGQEIIQESFSNFDTTITSGMTIAQYHGQGGVQEQQYACSPVASPSGMSIHHGHNSVQDQQVSSPSRMSIHHGHNIAQEQYAASPRSFSGMSPKRGNSVAVQQCASCQDEVNSRDSTIFGQNHQVLCSTCEKDAVEKCKSDLAEQDDDALKKELGKRIFAGWSLLNLNCPSCNMPLIAESKGDSGTCLRCG